MLVSYVYIICQFMSETLIGQFPKHIGSTGGLLNSAEKEEKYAICWNLSLIHI